MKRKYKNKYKIGSNRLPQYDYSQSGSYFITICTKNFVQSFGDIYKGEMYYNKLGKYADECWENIPQFHPYAIMDKYILMPNHLHGIIHIDKSESDSQQIKPAQTRYIASPLNNPETRRIASLLEPINSFGPQSQNLASIIRGFKSAVTTFAKKSGIEFAWLGNYHEWIINNDYAYYNFQQYIIDNPMRWDEKRYYDN